VFVGAFISFSVLSYDETTPIFVSFSAQLFNYFGKIQPTQYIVIGIDQDQGGAQRGWVEREPTLSRCPTEQLWEALQKVFFALGPDWEHGNLSISRAHPNHSCSE
jgi:hypothetical protein